MKAALQVTVLLLTVYSTGCASSKGYFIDRSRDAADIFTCSIGIGIGGKARVGPVQTGLLAQFDGIGLRGGSFPDLQDGGESWILPKTCDIQFIAVGGESFDSGSSITAVRHKDFSAACDGDNFPFFHRLPKDRFAPYYYTQLEVVAALGIGFRLGFNPGELLDFVLGWITIDIFQDDIEQRKQKKESAE